MCRHLLYVATFALSAHFTQAQQADTTVKFIRAPATRSKASIRREMELTRRRIDFIEGKTLEQQHASLAHSRAIGLTILTSGDEQTTYTLVHRLTPSEPEVHARWDDLVIIRSGTGAIATGDSLTGSRYLAPGERRGGTIVNGNQLVVHAGDIVRVPAAVPHAFLVSGQEPLEYVVIKQRRQTLPIRWFGDP